MLGVVEKAEALLSYVPKSPHLLSQEVYGPRQDYKAKLRDREHYQTLANSPKTDSFGQEDVDPSAIDYSNVIAPPSGAQDQSVGGFNRSYFRDLSNLHRHVVDFVWGVKGHGDQVAIDTQRFVRDEETDEFKGVDDQQMTPLSSIARERLVGELRRSANVTTQRPFDRQKGGGEKKMP